MEHCVFCEIAAGRAPASVVYEDELSLAFLDINPVGPGHLLIIPRAHHRNIYDCPPELAGRLMEVAAKLAVPVRDATGCQGMNLFMANEAIAGQEVWHIHLHLLPRYRNDGFGLRHPPGYPHRASRQELDEMAAKMRESWNRVQGERPGPSEGTRSLGHTSEEAQ